MAANEKPLLMEPHGGEQVTLGGSLFTIKVPGEATGGAYSVMEYRAAPGAGSPMHRHHREDEAFYILEGSLTFEFDGERFEAGVGAYVYLPRGLRHAFANRGERPVRALITVSPPGLEGYFRELGSLIRQPASDLALSEQIESLNQRYGLEFEQQ